jgi:hypothetical protein
MSDENFASVQLPLPNPSRQMVRFVLKSLGPPSMKRDA